MSEPAATKKEEKVEEGKPSNGYIGLIKRITPEFSQTYGKLTLQELPGIDVEGAPILDSFPSTGVVSVLAGMQLVKTMNLPLVGVFSSEDIPMCCTVHSEQVSNPARIYGNKSLVVFVCEFQLDDGVVPDMVDAVFDFAARHKSGMIFTVEGKPVSDKITLPSGEEVALSAAEDEGEEDGIKTYIDDTKLAELYIKEQEKKDAAEGEKKEGEEEKNDKHKKDKKKKKRKDLEDSEEEAKSEEQKKEELAEKLFGDKIHYLTTNDEMAHKLRDMGYIPVVDGIITNVTGGLLAKAPFETHDVTALLAPTSTLLPSPSSAVSLLKLLGTLLPSITICTSELEKLKEDIERVMKSVMKNLPSGAKNMPPSNLYT